MMIHLYRDGIMRTTVDIPDVDCLRARSNCVIVRPGPRNWEIFSSLCARANAQSKLVADAYHAALAIEHGCEWGTNDGDFARFEDLRWRHPLAAAPPT